MWSRALKVIDMVNEKAECPACSAVLKLPENRPTGKVRCPKCRASFVLPAASPRRAPAKIANGQPRKAAPPPDDDVEEEEIQEKPKARKKAAPPPDDEDDEEEVREKPKTKKKRRFKKKEPERSKTPIIVGSLLGVLVLGGIGFGVYWFTSGKKAEPTPQVAQNTPSGPASMLGRRGPRMGGQATPGQEGDPPAAEPSAPSAPEGGTGGGSSSEFSVGKRVFAENCTRCHKINGAGGNRGPDLTSAGRNPDHTADWLTDFIRNPKAVKAGSRMPSFGDKLDDAELRAVAEYLASLK